MKVVYVVGVKGENDPVPKMVKAFRKREEADHLAEIFQGYVNEVEVGF